MIFSVVQLIGGFIYLLGAADLLVRGAVALARRAQVPPMVVALTLVAFGTSLPELVVTLQAAVTGFSGIALGNVVGSNVANVLLVCGSAAIIYPLSIGGSSVRRDSLLMVGATLLLGILGFSLGLGRTAGVLLLLALVLVLSPTARDAARAHREAGGRAPLEAVLGLPTHRGMMALFIVVGVGFLPVGAWLVVDSAVDIAGRLGVSDMVIGASIIAFSTSLPELATTVMAAFRKETDVVVGTIVGSNIFNILVILGVASLVSPEPIQVPPSFEFLDLPAVLITALILTGFIWGKRAIDRTAGIALSTAYGAYLVALYVWG